MAQNHCVARSTRARDTAHKERNKMNCNDKMKAVVDALSYNPEVWNAYEECKEDWTPDYAIIEAYLMEEDYRDYDAAAADMIATIVETIGDEVKIVRGFKQEKPASGYVLHIWPKSGGFNFEFELYKMKS